MPEELRLIVRMCVVVLLGFVGLETGCPRRRGRVRRVRLVAIVAGRRTSRPHWATGRVVEPRRGPSMEDLSAERSVKKKNRRERA